MSKNFELDLTDLRCICDPAMFNFKDTSGVEPLDGVIGQERAVRAIDFGLNMRSPGYNIFVTGIEGTGKSTIVRDIVSRHAKTLPTPDDWCMVNNFKDEYVPKAIAVPPGKAVKFSRTMNKMIEDLKTELPKAFQDETYQQRQSAIQQRFADQRRDIYKNLEKFAEERNLRIQRTATAYQPIPFHDGKPLSAEDFQALPEQKREEIEENLRIVRAETESIVREVSKINKNMQKKLEKLMEEIALYVVWDQINDIKEEFKESARIPTYLDEVRDDIVENVKDFIAAQEDTEAARAAFNQAVLHLRGRSGARGGGHPFVQALCGLAQTDRDAGAFQEALDVFRRRGSFDFSPMFCCMDDVTLLELARGAKSLGETHLARQLLSEAIDVGSMEALSEEMP